MRRLSLLLTIVLVACGGGKGGLLQDAAPSPDGSIAFVVDYVGSDADNDIYTIWPDGSHLKRLTQDTYLNRNPAWSPDGRFIAFTSNRGGYFSNLFVMRPDGSRQQNLTKNDVDHRVVTWTTDGRVLMYEGTGNTYLLKLIDPADPKSAYAVSDQRLYNAALSPDGKRIAFDDFRSVSVMDAGDQTTTRLTPSVERLSNQQPAWSPDGKRIAFVSNRDGAADVYVMEADGASPTRLSNGGPSAKAPAWSPDGTHIAFLRQGSELAARAQLWVVSADSSGEKRIGVQDCDGQHGFTWSPDGKRLAFVRGCHADYREDPSTLYVINVDGTNETRIAASIKRSITDPAWSPAPKP
jgi:Tol biopolymer transport system component